jgi:hypothetical protein
MIRAHVRPHGGQPQMILLGLSEENIKRLKENQPIFFDATPFGFAGNICIVYGVTEEAIKKEFHLPDRNTF